MPLRGRLALTSTTACSPATIERRLIIDQHRRMTGWVMTGGVRGEGWLWPAQLCVHQPRLRDVWRLKGNKSMSKYVLCISEDVTRGCVIGCNERACQISDERVCHWPLGYLTEGSDNTREVDANKSCVIPANPLSPLLSDDRVLFDFCSLLLFPLG